MRTTAVDTIKLAWAIYRCPLRRHLRIGQLLENASQTLDPGYTSNCIRADLFNQENRELIGHVARYADRLARRPETVNDGRT